MVKQLRFLASNLASHLVDFPNNLSRVQELHKSSIEYDFWRKHGDSRPFHFSIEQLPLTRLGRRDVEVNCGIYTSK